MFNLQSILSVIFSLFCGNLLANSGISAFYQLFNALFFKRWKVASITRLIGRSVGPSVCRSVCLSVCLSSIRFGNRLRSVNWCKLRKRKLSVLMSRVLRHHLQIPKTISGPGRTKKVPVGPISFSRSLGWWKVIKSTLFVLMSRP